MDTVKIELFSTRSNENIHQIIGDTLKLQASLIATRETARQKEGFLISSFSYDELAGLITGNGKLFMATFRDVLVGYLLVTPISEFLSLIDEASPHASCGYFKPTQDICFSDFDYLYQI